MARIQNPCDLPEGKLQAVIADLQLIETYALDRDDVTTMLKAKRILDNIAAVARQALDKLGEPRENHGKAKTRRTGF